MNTAIWTLPSFSMLFASTSFRVAIITITATTTTTITDSCLRSLRAARSTVPLCFRWLGNRIIFFPMALVVAAAAGEEIE